MDSNIFYFTIVILILLWIYKKYFEGGENLETLGIAHEKPLPLIGNSLSTITKSQGFVEFGDHLYEKFSDKKIYGFYSLFGNYTVIISDPALAKQIMIKDFDYFVNRDQVDPDKVDRLLGKSVLMLRDQKWKNMRATLSPVFTSSKLKQMYVLLQNCMTDFISLYEEKALEAQGQVVIDTHEVFARITADGITTTALGFEGDCIRNEKSEIFKIAEAMEADFTSPNALILLNLCPGLCKFFGIQIFRKSIHEFFESNVLNEIQRRQETNVQRSDVIDLLIQAKKGNLKADTGVEAEEVDMKNKPNFQWTDEDLVAQALVFFLGGFETTATLMQSFFWELAQNAEVQQKLINEVDEMIEVLDDKPISYEQLNQMKYLDMVINETLRKWPSFRITSRLCSKDYTLKTDTGKNYIIKKGIEIFIPIGSIQMDPKYFANPEKFDPERFNDENKKNIQNGTFLPFGTGPRICIGSRYATIKSKLLLFYVLSKFKVEKSNTTPDKLIFSNGTSGYKEKIFVALTLRK